MLYKNHLNSFIYNENKNDTSNTHNTHNTSNTNIMIENYYNNLILPKLNILKYENGKISDNIKEDIKLSISMSRYLLLKSLIIIKERFNLKNTYILGLKYKGFNDIQFLVSGSQKENEIETKSMIRELNEELFITMNDESNLLYSGIILNRNKKILLYNLNINSCDIKKNIDILENNNIPDIYRSKVSTLIHGNKSNYIEIFKKYQELNIHSFNDNICGIYIININELIESLIKV
jgi:hypothetical protein